MVVVFDANTGVPAAFLLDNGFITDFRTGAAGAVGAKYLARKKITTVAVIGTGGQARYQIEMLALQRNFSEVRIWGRDPHKAQTVADDLAKSRSDFGVQFFRERFRAGSSRRRRRSHHSDRQPRPTGPSGLVQSLEQPSSQSVPMHPTNRNLISMYLHAPTKSSPIVLRNASAWARSITQSNAESSPEEKIYIEFFFG